MITNPTGRCQRCGRSAICWPRTLTVVGPMDLCGNCYWEYLRAIQPLEAYFSPHFSTTSEYSRNTTNQEKRPMSDRLKIECGPADQLADVRCCACGADEHRDRFNTDDAFRRRKFATPSRSFAGRLRPM